VIAYRDTRGGFDSLDELDDIPGLPKETRGTLKGLLTH
jgi:DNA uptake protein ComE-like DNA-binding protein